MVVLGKVIADKPNTVVRAFSAAQQVADFLVAMQDVYEEEEPAPRMPGDRLLVRRRDHTDALGNNFTYIVRHIPRVATSR